MKIALASDHGGYELKEKIKKYLQEKHEILDLGTNSADSVDYPEFGRKLAQTVAQNKVDRGIAICGTGIGISITANKVKGIRAALCTNTYMAEMSRKHNNANVLALGGRVIKEKEAKKIVDVWLTTDFEGGRHQHRIDMISNIEE